MNQCASSLIFCFVSVGLFINYDPVECTAQNVDVPPPLGDPNVIFLVENNKRIQSEKNKTNEIDFKCAGRAPGYYADVGLGCKNFYMCEPGGRQHYFECGLDTIFNQWLLICDHKYNYDCRVASKHFSVNEERRPFEDDEKRAIVERSNGVRRPN